jgi:hypothetical protein
VVAVLAVAGAFSNDDEEDRTTTTTTGPAPAVAERPAPSDGEERPAVTTVEVGGRPTAVSAGPAGIWVADSFSSRATVVRPGSGNAKPRTFRLDGPASDVAVTEGDAWFALPEQQAIERRSAADPATGGDVVELDGFPSAVAADEARVYALSERAVESVDAESGDVVDRFDVGGFGSSVAVDGNRLWVVVDNREVAVLEAESGQTQGEPVEVREAFGIAARNGAAWVVSASGEVTRIDSESLETTVSPAPVKGALDVAAGDGAVWVTSSRRTATQLDPDTLEPVAKPLRVGDEAASVSVGDDAVWVANGGDGTLSRIEP